jgi:hypothetical protein
MVEPKGTFHPHQINQNLVAEHVVRGADFTLAKHLAAKRSTANSLNSMHARGQKFKIPVKNRELNRSKKRKSRMIYSHTELHMQNSSNIYIHKNLNC